MHEIEIETGFFLSLAGRNILCLKLQMLHLCAISDYALAIFLLHSWPNRATNFNKTFNFCAYIIFLTIQTVPIYLMIMEANLIYNATSNLFNFTCSCQNKLCCVCLNTIFTASTDSNR